MSQSHCSVRVTKRGGSRLKLGCGSPCSASAGGGGDGDGSGVFVMAPVLVCSHSVIAGPSCRDGLRCSGGA